jgi:outer membrane protein, multidrug efflux system
MTRITWTLLPLMLAACSSTPPPQRPALSLPAQYVGQTDSARPVLAADWWKLYGEPGLNDLVDRALATNLDLRLAAARVDETAVAVGLARAAQWPSLDLSSSVTRSRASVLTGQPASPNGPESTSHRVSLNTSFEVDLWGRLRNATQAAQEQLLASQYARDTVRVALVGTVVQTWFAIRSLDVQQETVARQLQLRVDSAALVKRRADGGIASGLDVAQAESQLAALAAQQIELKRQRELLVNQLALLVGQPGLQLPFEARPLPQPAPVPAGLPSDLLLRRPDVQQAEASMRALFEQFEVTRKSAWPTLSLTGSFGAQSADLLDLLKAGARTWSIGPSLLVSLFDAGRAQARNDEARARAEQASISWQKTAQVAFREVGDALVGVQQFAAQEAEVERQSRAALEAQRISARRYDAGYSGYLDVLDAQRVAQDAELALQRIRQARLDAHVALQKALGGGWQPEPAADTHLRTSRR